jgi:hypothetical protein
MEKLMGQIVDLSRMYIRNDDMDYDLETEVHQDITSELQLCKDMKNLPGNGFWDGRNNRQIGCIPNVAYLKAIQDGYELESTDSVVRSREFKRFLNDHPEFRTENHINTPGHTGKIIIK